jgi:hypothetical protein
MAILAALVAFGSKYAGKVLTTALGWASTLLFGRVPASRQMALAAITFGSVIWMVLVAGVVYPDLGTFLLLFVPSQNLVPESVIRLAMLIGALIAPAVIGAMTLTLTPGATRSGIPAAIVRGYPLTLVLAFLLVFLAALAIWRKAHSLVRRWTDAHVPFIVKPGAYDQVADDLRRAILDAGIEVRPRPAPAVMSTPARWLAAVADRRGSGLVPERMIQLQGPGLEILIYPMDLLLSGKPDLVMRARAATASRLTTASAHLTVSAEAEAIEDRLTGLARRSPATFSGDVAEEFATIDDQLATIRIPYEEWEVLYRQRLQVERDIRARAITEAEGSSSSEGSPATAPTAYLGQLLMDSSQAVVNAASDKQSMAALGRLNAPWPWRAGVILGVAIVPILAGAARRLLRRSRIASAAARHDRQRQAKGSKL